MLYDHKKHYSILNLSCIHHECPANKFSKLKYKQSLKKCEGKINEHKLTMYIFNRNKIILTGVFLAEGRNGLEQLCVACQSTLLQLVHHDYWS